MCPVDGASTGYPCPWSLARVQWRQLCFIINERRGEERRGEGREE
jgi:hypothetical protein